MSYAHIALTAYDNGNGRKRLATMLLDYEPNPSDQVSRHVVTTLYSLSRFKVKLLLRMNEHELALQKAVNSMQPDLVIFRLDLIPHWS